MEQGGYEDLLQTTGFPFMVLLWTALSYTVPSEVPEGVPRRLVCPLPWEPSVTVPLDSDQGYGKSSVASQMAQQKEFNLQKPSAYHYDILLLGVMTLICGLLGLPPSNGVLPQSPMHTRSLAVLRRQLIRKKVVKSAKECIEQQRSSSEIYGKMQAIFIEMDTSPTEDLKEAVMKSDDGGDAKGKFDPEKHIDAFLPVRVNEQRSPRESILGKDIATFHHPKPALQSIGRLPCFIRGVGTIQVHCCFYSLPIFIFSALFWHDMDTYSWNFVSFSILPSHSYKRTCPSKLFDPTHLQELDASEYEEIAGAPQHGLGLSITEREPPDNGNEESTDDFFDAELLDEITTRRRS
ncbi:putative Boron transporter [Quillaja saponaria]|uniref:Boron transporter n=1 Tax=Quillaja saponaria TaxID=32244 RepID=A0AAD7LIY4_QUISA|nr:putative Boron transporter [Quillaja saponaria]